MKHRYDFDSATVAGFLLEHGFDKNFELNIEANPAALEGYSRNRLHPMQSRCCAAWNSPCGIAR